MDFSLTTYFPIFIYLVIVLGFAVSAPLVAHLVSPRKITPVKQMPYESGMDPIGDTRQKFDVKFYLIAILFIVFDVEFLFLYPWVATYQGNGYLPAAFHDPAFWGVQIFLLPLLIAFIYEWRKGVFTWR